MIAALAVAGFAIGSDQPARSAAPVDDLSLRQLVGQRIVTGYIGSKPPAAILRAVRRGEVGGIIVFKDNVPTRAVARRTARKLQAAARAGGQPKLFLMVDQEGGIVKRFEAAPPKRSPKQMGRARDVGKVALAEGRATGKMLSGVGINVNLAPAVDVPDRDDSFLGNRAFSKRPSVVATGGCAFARGLQSKGVSATFKHFPGLGHARGDTDLELITIHSTSRAIKADWLPYETCPATPDMMMISSAKYPALGINVPSSLSRKTYSLLAETGFAGLTISDALGTPGVGNRKRLARRLVLAGLDLLLYTQVKGESARGYRQLLADARGGRLKESELRASAARILALKAKLVK